MESAVIWRQAYCKSKIRVESEWRSSWDKWNPWNRMKWDDRGRKEGKGYRNRRLEALYTIKIGRLLNDSSLEPNLCHHGVSEGEGVAFSTTSVAMSVVRYTFAFELEKEPADNQIILSDWEKSDRMCLAFHAEMLSSFHSPEIIRQNPPPMPLSNNSSP